MPRTLPWTARLVCLSVGTVCARLFVRLELMPCAMMDTQQILWCLELAAVVCTPLAACIAALRDQHQQTTQKRQQLKETWSASFVAGILFQATWIGLAKACVDCRAVYYALFFGIAVLFRGVITALLREWELVHALPVLLYVVTICVLSEQDSPTSHNPWSIAISVVAPLFYLAVVAFERRRFAQQLGSLRKTDSAAAPDSRRSAPFQVAMLSDSVPLPLAEFVHALLATCFTVTWLVLILRSHDLPCLILFVAYVRLTQIGRVTVFLGTLLQWSLACLVVGAAYVTVLIVSFVVGWDRDGTPTNALVLWWLEVLLVSAFLYVVIYLHNDSPLYQFTKSSVGILTTGLAYLSVWLILVLACHTHCPTNNVYYPLFFGTQLLRGLAAGFVLFHRYDKLIHLAPAVVYVADMCVLSEQASVAPESIVIAVLAPVCYAAVELSEHFLAARFDLSQENVDFSNKVNVIVGVCSGFTWLGLLLGGVTGYVQLIVFFSFFFVSILVKLSFHLGGGGRGGGNVSSSTDTTSVQTQI
jgi:hypothetical protein